MSEIPQSSLSRTTKLAALPMAAIARATVGLGKRIGGKSGEYVAQEMQAKAADQIFRVLGELKGGAMKLGQALSVLEAALPEEYAAPYRETLTKLQDSAPAIDIKAIHQVIAQELGEDWRKRFVEFDDVPAAAASIGQVHKAVWRDGRTVAVKVQYPGADKALLNDLNQASALGRALGVWIPGLDAKPLIAEAKERVAEELDYLQEAEFQKKFAIAFEGDDEFLVPHVVSASPHVIVSEWVDGTPLSKVITKGTQSEKNKAGLLYQRFLLSGPNRVGLMHADPHPGNYRMTDDGRLCVFDFGAVAQMPGGFPESTAKLLANAFTNDGERVIAAMREEKFLKPNIKIDPEAIMQYLAPFTEPAASEVFQYSREWLQSVFSKINNPKNPNFNIAFKLNLPPSYLLIHRTWLGTIGVLSQLNAKIPSRSELNRFIPGLNLA
jgi:predicted unusual protein kinase regulating ubiquinone biosynthesis (AarF/ABC1/UbiB family)